MKVFIILSAVILLCCSPVAAQIDPLIDEIFGEGKLPEAKKKSILTNLFSGIYSPALISDLETSADERLVNIWRGNSPDVSTEINSFSLNLVSAEGRPYSLHISFQKGHVVLRHSLPPRPELAGGVRLPLYRDRNTALIMEGRENTNLGAVIGAAENSSKALLICPLKTESSLQRQGSRVSSYAFGDFSASFDAKAHARGHVLTGVNEGAAHAYLNTFGAVSPPALQIVTSQQRSPSVELTYSPSGDTLGNGSSELNAIVAVLDLTLPAGYRRQTISASLVSLGRESIREPIVFSLRSRRLNVDSPECILAYSDTFDSQRYLE